MAIVRKLEHLALERDSRHTEVEATYSVISNDDGEYLQIDSYRSQEQKLQGKKSQSIRLAPEAIRQLKQIIEQLH